MTVLQGARPMVAGGLGINPRVQQRAGARPLANSHRRRISSPARARRRSQPFGAVIAVVLVALVVGLIYVAQTIQLAATNYEIDGLIAERDDLARQVQTLETSVLRWGTEATVLERAQRIGLNQLETRIRLPAR
ncbi:MAG: hypothetical protein WD830_10855 [Chloroflexota bacterium]